ncbi:MAG: hypothetical protein COW01_02290 [Bdellovibrionales bacterium CG12_big_fil_rev_8_21_14_0_65_38_15]|nr:MAG: hypothetical protein COW79_02525 [Bdellovibrionales bacterium CG22_combo_CG10-13_8_21_14_all_38_13]PIQ57136.1 MAG: hypothetical protein COW01_02290 [Bdellovibrionales bacterium CG12_big_fil_rev_8_21_14_0_65_38_15]PIR30166.1 MAG: hypothetical protein COV38_07685 [Bdellovibrionales bacterium CG11_big_fil_rev_8_21_14_0_20_38_13]
MVNSKVQSPSLVDRDTRDDCSLYVSSLQRFFDKGCLKIGRSELNSKDPRRRETGLNIYKKSCVLGLYASCAVFAYASHKGLSYRDEEAFELTRFGCENGNKTSCEAKTYLDFKYNNIGKIEDFL